MIRRVFIEKTLKASAAAIAGVTLVACGEDDIQPDLGNGIEIDLTVSPFDQLKEADSWVLHPDLNLILVNDGISIKAYTSVCTHTQCTRNWVFGTTEATCTCHGSIFNNRGEVVKGPAQSNLASFAVQQNGDDLKVG